MLLQSEPDLVNPNLVTKPLSPEDLTKTGTESFQEKHIIDTRNHNTPNHTLSTPVMAISVALPNMTPLMLVRAIRGGKARAPGRKNTAVHVASKELVWREDYLGFFSTPFLSGYSHVAKLWLYAQT
eukprot:sb/3475570/